MRSRESEACEAVGTRDRDEYATGTANGKLVACRWKGPPIDTHRARRPHAVTPEALSSEAISATRP